MDKEQTYDDEISPLMAQIIATCKRAGIACFCTFDLSTKDNPGFYCTTCIPDQDGVFPSAIKDCENRLYRNASHLAVIVADRHSEEESS